MMILLVGLKFKVGLNRIESFSVSEFWVRVKIISVWSANAEGERVHLLVVSLFLLNSTFTR